MKAWHFLPDDRRMRYGARELVEVGRTYTADGPLVLCENGMHASKRLIDALRYATGSVICRVDMSGDMIHGDDKTVARNRTVLWMLDGSNVLHGFACRVAERALRDAGVDDERPWNALRAKRAWLRGEISDADLAAAYWAADSAAYSAADSAAHWATYWAAYWAADCAAYRAAYSAAYSAADSAAHWAADRAAYRAAYSAAYWAAYSAAYRAAYWAADWAADWAAWNRTLTGMVVAAHRKQEATQ